MPEGLLKYTLLSICFLSLNLLSQAQESLLVVAFGKLKVEYGNLDLTKITVFEDGKQLDLFYPKSNGKFEFQLKLNHQYLFWFEKPGYVTKKVDFNTKVPQEVLDNLDFEPFPDFDFYVTLFKSYPDVDTMFFTKPVGKIKYSADINDFDYDKEYTLEIIKRMEEIENEIKRRNEAEDVLAKTSDDQDLQAIPTKTEEPEKVLPETQNTAPVSEVLKPETEQNNTQIKEKKPLSQAIKTPDNAPQNVKTVPNPVAVAQSNRTKNTSQIEVAGRTITRTEVNQGNMTLVYIKVVYTWGGKFFFIQDETNQYRNISENYYNVMVSKN